MTINHSYYYAGLNTSGIPVVNPNTVSNSLDTGERGFIGVVSESGKPILDSEINLHGTLSFENQRRWSLQNNPSGFVLGSKRDSSLDYAFETIGALSGPTEYPNNLNGTTLINSFLLSKQELWVAGYPLTLEYSNIDEKGYNLILLPEATPYDGTSNTLKRTDFVFLEVWKSLVAPDLIASARIQVVDEVNDGEILTILGNDFVAVSATPGASEFEVSPNLNTLASNIVTAINLALIGVTAKAVGTNITIYSDVPGSVGNSITMSTDSLGLSVPASLTGGVDRPNKPQGGFIYRHGNTQSLESAWISDTLMDSNLKSESSQRIQLQYRIRVASDIDFKNHPDGFSNSSARFYAQGGREVEVYNGNSEGDTRTYPFVRADNTSIQDESNSTLYGLEDAGLWVAGEGTEQSAQDLNSLDGFVYAIPICMVFRHNDAFNGAIQGFDPLNNTNGAPIYDHVGYTGVLGVVPAGVSDHPNQDFCDVVKSHQVLDMRKHLLPSFVDLQNEALFQIQSLMDLSTRSWAIDISDKETLGGGSGELSTMPLVCFEVGRTDSLGGVAPSSGDSGRGECVRNFDHIARRFGAHSVVERVVFAFYPGDRPSAGVQGGVAGLGQENAAKYVTKATIGPILKDSDGWYEDDVLVLNLNDLDCSTLGSLFQGLADGGTSTALPKTFAELAPPGTCITDVLNIWHDDGHYTTAVDQSVACKTIKGIGSLHLEITLDANDSVVNGGDSGNADYRMVGSDVGGVTTADGSQRRIFVEVEVTYPTGEGPLDTVWETLTPDATFYDGSAEMGPGPIIQNDITQRPNDYENINVAFREGYREVYVDYVANETLDVGDPSAVGVPVGTVSVETLVSTDRFNVKFPRRLSDNAVTIEDAVASSSKVIDTNEYGSSTNNVSVTTALSGTGQTLCNVTYFPQDPIPCYGGVGFQTSIYYRTVAPQTAGSKDGFVDSANGGLLPSQISIQPLAWPQMVWASATGSGSLERSFPYSLPTEAIPLNAPVDDWFLTGTPFIGTSVYESNTGIIQLNTTIPIDLQSDVIVGDTGVSQRPTKDSGFRSYYPYMEEGSHRQVVLSQPLFDSCRHKTWTAFLGRVKEELPNGDDVTLFRKNEIVLVVFTRISEMDSSTDIKITDSNNTGCIAIYRTKNNLLGV